MSEINRRKFLLYVSSGVAGSLLLSPKDLHFLEPKAAHAEEGGDDLQSRDWEEVYREQYRYDDSFTFVCVPNDTHNCRLRAFVRNGIATRIEPAYDSAGAVDLYGNKASATWNPRGCLKGYSILRRVYGPHRIKFPTVRKAWKGWVEAGCPRDPESMRRAFARRGEDERLRVSWEDAFDLVARATRNIAEAYSGEEGARRLESQGYPKAMIDKLEGAGTRAIKMRTSVGLLGPITKHGALVRFANMLALLDASIRKVGPDEAKAATHWSTYEYLGDMDPGFPQVTGVNAFDCDINDLRDSRLSIFIGKNLVENKMADIHWGIQGMERGAKMVLITPDYNPSATKADYWVPVRPGSDTALLLCVANELVRSNRYAPDFVARYTDLPLLVRTDTLKLLRAADVFPDYTNATNTGYSADVQKISPELRAEWGDFVMWDSRQEKPVPITREEIGERSNASPDLEAEVTIRLVDGSEVRCCTGFQLLRKTLSYYTVERTTEITGTPEKLIRQLAEDVATIKPMAIHSGEGVNHWQHADLKGRAVFLLCALTGNVGDFGAGPGTWAGNYKINVFDGFGVYAAEDPFQANETPPKVRGYWRGENPVFWVYGGTTQFTGDTHMPTPTKAIWTANTNMVNNSAWLYRLMNEELPKVEMIVKNDWEYTLDCEYADVVFPVPSWPETHLPDMTASCTNPFFHIWKGGMEPLYDTRMDCEITAGVAQQLGKLTDDARFEAYWKYILEGKPEWYIQRVMDASSTLAGYDCEEILKSEKAWLMNFRTYPRVTGWEQIQESVPFYNKTGRLEFYKEEDNWLKVGENIIVHREPVEATPYLPNAIVCHQSEGRRPEDYGIPLGATSAEDRQLQNRVIEWEELKEIRNPMLGDQDAFVLLTTKTRHTNHSSWAVADWNLIWASNFGDPERSDKRAPGVGEPNVEINPDDGKRVGVEDGDYVYVDAAADDRPYPGWKETDTVARLMVRCKYSPRVQPGSLILRHGGWAATTKTVAAQKNRADGRALADSGYQASFRHGSHESCVRMYLNPTFMSDELVRKGPIGQAIGKGQANDAYGVNAPYKETLVRVSFAEAGGKGGKGVWEPVRSGKTPGHEDEIMLHYLNGDFLR